MTRYEKIKEILDNMNDGNLLCINNEYCYATNNYDDEIFDMCMFDEQCEGMTPTDIAQRIFYGDFRPCDAYFKYNGYANFESFDYPLDHVYTEDIASYIDDHEDSLFNDDIQEVLDEYEEEEEEEE